MSLGAMVNYDEDVGGKGWEKEKTRGCGASKGGSLMVVVVQRTKMKPRWFSSSDLEAQLAQTGPSQISQIDPAPEPS